MNRLNTDDPILMTPRNSEVSSTLSEGGSLYKDYIHLQFFLMIKWISFFSLDLLAVYLVVSKIMQCYMVGLILFVANIIINGVFLIILRKKVNGVNQSQFVLLSLTSSLFYLTLAMVSFQTYNYVLLVAPLTLHLALFAYCNFKCFIDNETEILLGFAKIFIQVLLFAQHICILLKLAGVVGWSFKHIFWCYWVMLTIMLGFGIMTVFLFFWTLTIFGIVIIANVKCKNFLFHLLVLACVSPCSLLEVFKYQRFLDALCSFMDAAEPAHQSGDLSSLLKFVAIICGTNLFYCIAIALFQNRLLVYIEGLMTNRDELHASGFEEPAPNLAESVEVRRTKKKIISIENIPRTIKKFTSTYFKMAEVTMSRENSVNVSKTKEKEKQPAKIGKHVRNKKSITMTRKINEGYTKPKADSLSCSVRLSADRAPHSEDRAGNAEAHNHSRLNESTVLCNVCFANEPDVVFMPCGHGGLCLKCAQDIWLATSECYLCRQSIECVLRYDNSDKKNDLYKVIEMYQETEEPESINSNRN